MGKCSFYRWVYSRAVGRQVAVKTEGGKFETKDGFIMYYYKSANHDLGTYEYTVILPSVGMSICSAPKLKDAKALTEEYMPKLLEKCLSPDFITKEKRFIELVAEAEERERFGTEPITF